MSITADVQKLIVEGKITLFQLDLSNYLAGTIFYFHGHTNFYDQFDSVANSKSDIIWQGQVYSPIPISVAGLEQRTDGKASSPTLQVGNVLNGVQGGMTALCLQFKDLANSKLTVIETYVKYLDAANFLDGNPTASNDCSKQIWYVEQKTNETSQALSFDLSNPIDYEGEVLPSRMASKQCEWALKNRYRGEECQYLGTTYFTDRDEPTDDPSKDSCSGSIKGCKLRHGEENPLPHGGFPASGMI